jgi:hypothetical protein
MRYQFGSATGTAAPQWTGAGKGFRIIDPLALSPDVDPAAPPPPSRSDESAIYQGQVEHEGLRDAQTKSGWGPLLAFAAVMAVPFALVAWLMA